MAKDKCNNCGSTDSKKYWDFEDDTMLCDECHKKYGDEWQKEIEDNKNELFAEELSFWAFTGRWAIIFIILGIILIFAEQIIAGIFVLVLSLGYILFRVHNIKNRAKKLNMKYPAWWKGMSKFFLIIGLIVFMIIFFLLGRFVTSFFLGLLV